MTIWPENLNPRKPSGLARLGPEDFKTGTSKEGYSKWRVGRLPFGLYNQARFTWPSSVIRIWNEPITCSRAEQASKKLFKLVLFTQQTIPKRVFNEQTRIQTRIAWFAKLAPLTAFPTHTLIIYNSSSFRKKYSYASPTHPLFCPLFLEDETW